MVTRQKPCHQDLIFIEPHRPIECRAGWQSLCRLRTYIKMALWSRDWAIAPVGDTEWLAGRRWISRLTMQLHVPGPSLS